MHTSCRAPDFLFDAVVVGTDQILGEVGGGYELTREWFVEERLMIAGRATGAAEPALSIATQPAAERVQFGGPIIATSWSRGRSPTASATSRCPT